MESSATQRSFRISLLEIVITIGILAVTSSLIIQLFLTANSLQREAVNTSKAMIQAENIAELLKGSTSFEAVLMELGLSKKTDESGMENSLIFQRYFNQIWDPIQTPGVHILQVTISTQVESAGRMETAVITVFKEKGLFDKAESVKERIKITVKKYHTDEL